MDEASPSVSQLEAKELAGKRWRINGDLFRFADYDPREPGQPPWKSGAEGIAYPLLGTDGTAQAYVKFFDALRVNTKRVNRTKWLIDQQMGTWVPELGGAPRLWVDTNTTGQPDGIGFDFACSLAKAAPGRTWLEMKVDVADGLVQLDDELRERCVCNLVRAVVHLEQRDVVHGDLSPNNVIVDVGAAPSEPALCLIDFDGFVAPAAGRSLYRLTAAEGGTFGTRGYCPPELERQCSNNDLSVAPYSDRYARDMLLLELLCYDESCDFEEPVSDWALDKLRFGLERSRFRNSLAYLNRPDIFTLSEKQRPATEHLASEMRIPHPPRVKKTAFSVKGFPGFNAPPPLSWVERMVGTATNVLLMFCVSLLGIFCFCGAEWLGGSSSAGGVQTALRLLAKVLLGGGVFVAGVTGLTVVGFATDRPRMVNVAGWWLRIPARRENDRSEIANQIRASGILLGISFVLGICVVALRRLV